MKRFYTTIWLFIAVSTAMVGHQIHHSLFWSIMDFCFWPVTWCKWLIMHQVNATIIKSAFSFLAQ